MALLATPTVRRIETALNTNISRHKIETNDDIQGIGVQNSHQTVTLWCIDVIERHGVIKHIGSKEKQTSEGLSCVVVPHCHGSCQCEQTHKYIYIYNEKKKIT